MTSTFFGLEMGKNALAAQQRALDVTGHNISNANTVGYTRQEAVLKASLPYTVPAFNSPVAAGQVGTGVEVSQIRRIQDSFINGQIRTENQTLGEWEARRDALEQLEVILNEPSDAGLRTVMDQFWESLQTLSSNPEDSSARAVVIERGITLADTFNHLDRQLTDLQDDLDQSVTLKVQEINGIADQIARLNKQIVVLEVAGNEANDLRDERDLLIDQLSKMADISVTEDPSGFVTVSIGGNALVDNTTVDPLLTVGSPATLQWTSGAALPAATAGGELYGMIDARDTTVQAYIDQLDDLADALITQFNTIHSGGYGLDGISGRDFFSGTDAGSIAVLTDIIDNPDHIAASNTSTGVPGDNGNAIDLAQLKQTAIGSLDGGTMDDYYRGMAAKLGIDSESAQRMVDNQNILIDQLDIRKQEVSGVSLDEEMTNMIKFEHSYSAASRLITTLDEMLDQIINQMGLVGR